MTQTEAVTIRPRPVEPPEDYGDPAAEYGALHQAAALIPPRPETLLAVTGPDRVRFIQGLVTVDVAAIQPGAGGYGYFTDKKGRILADAAILAEQDRLVLQLPRDRRQTILEHLEHYRIMERVEFEPLTESEPLAVAGPEWQRVFGADLDAGSDSIWRHGVFERAGARLRWVIDARLGLPGCIVWGVADDLDRWVEALATELEGEAPRPVGREAATAVRIEAGVPWWGIDFDQENLPQEVGQEGAVSLEKGCYLGQEVVARIHYRGRVNRTIVPVRFDGEAPPDAGTTIRFEGHSVGRVRSVARSPRHGAIGLALLHRKAAEPGTRLESALGTAEVLERPLAAT